MEKKEFVKRLYAGIFLIIGIALIIIVVLAIGMEKGFTQPKFTVKALFHEVGGLSVGAPIRLSGVNVGTVGKIDFLDEKVSGRAVEVTMLMFTRYKKQLERSSRVAIKTEGILGEKFIEISTNEDKPKIDLSHPVIGDDPLDVQSLAESFRNTADSLTETSKQINMIMLQLDDITRTSKRLLNRIEERVIEGNLFRMF